MLELWRQELVEQTNVPGGPFRPWRFVRGGLIDGQDWRREARSHGDGIYQVRDARAEVVVEFTVSDGGMPR
jgi:hypothetical protein